MHRDDVIARLKPALRSFGVAALYLFGSHARDAAASESDVDVFVDPASDDAFGFLGRNWLFDPHGAVTLHSKGCGTRSPADLLMAANTSPRARLLHIRDEIEGVAVVVKGGFLPTVSSQLSSPARC
jgi:hypothetical protein